MTKNLGGRPLKFKTVAELQKKIDAYFAACDPHIETVTVLEYPTKEQKKGNKTIQIPDSSAEPVEVKRKRISTQVPYTVTGLALALDTTRETLLDYENKDKFSDAIKRAKLKIHNFTELKLFENNSTGAIFNLKNNYGWRDRTEQESIHSGEVSFVNDVPRPKN
jgi:hypothetical protein